MIPLVIFHANCRDGMCSAAIMYDWMAGDCELYPMSYGETLKAKVKGREVYMVDFSLPRHDIIQIASMASSVTILDHHATASENLVDLPHNVSFRFEPSLSGAGLTWQHCYPDITAPMIVKFVQDRDLWLFEYVATKAINAALAAYYPTIEEWISEWYALQNNTYLDEHLVPAGEGILAMQDKHVAQAASHAVPAKVNGTEVMLTNSCLLQSEVGNHLVHQHEKPAGIWYVTSSGDIAVSWRSADGYPSARTIAESFGGGGHRNAAGCVIKSLDEIKEAA